MTLGEKLVGLRQSSGLSQDRLAEMLGVSRQAVSKWERDEAKPDIDNIIKLSNIYNVTIDYLLKENQEEMQNEKHESIQANHGSSIFQDVLTFIKKKWYWLGYVIAAWGIIDIFKAIIGNIMWRSFTSSIIGYDMSGAQIDITSSATELIESNLATDPLIGSVMNVSSYALWYPILIGVLKSAVGVIIVIYGRRYVKNLKAKAYN